MLTLKNAFAIDLNRKSYFFDKRLKEALNNIKRKTRWEKKIKKQKEN